MRVFVVPGRFGGRAWRVPTVMVGGSAEQARLYDPVIWRQVVGGSADQRAVVDLAQIDQGFAEGCGCRRLGVGGAGGEGGCCQCEAGGHD